MEIKELKQHYYNFSQWITSLENLKEETWISPIAEGKWSIAAVIAHLLLWDKHSLVERFPHFKKNAELEPFPDFQKVNDEATVLAETSTKEEILKDLLSVRGQFISILDDITEDALDTPFKIGTHSLTIRGYMKDFIDHDLHHQKQVDSVLGGKIIS